MSNWFKIQAKAGSDTADILLFDEIGGWGITAQNFIDQVQATGAKKLTVRINSPGGSVFHGLAIYNFLARFPDVTTVVEGVAASMASVILLAGKKRRMAENSFVMVHAPSGEAYGTAEDLRNAADLLDKLGGSISALYQKLTGATEKTVNEWMSGDTWFDSRQALAAGFVSEVTDPVKAVASLRPSFRNVPVALSATTNTPQKNRMNKLMEALAKAGLITAADVAEDAAVTQVVANLAKLSKERDEAVTAKTTAETALATSRKANATALVDAAITDGRIEATAKDEWIAKLSAIDGAEKLLGSIKKPVVGHAPIGAGNHNDPNSKDTKTLTERCIEARKASASKN